MKYSLIIPVYNVEAYLDKCLDSISKQTYKNFEVIIVNDGTPDNSQKIIDKYIKKDKRFKGYIKENGGLSDARNYGIEHITGDYMLFIDSDDFIEEELLLKINNIITIKKYDLVRFSLSTTKDNGEKIKTYHLSDNLNKLQENEKICKLLKEEFVEPAWLYAYNTTFFKKNKFKYPKGKIHEDFGLTLLILSKAKNIYFLDYPGYNYVQRENSIMSNNQYEKIKKRVDDFLYHHLNNQKKLGDNIKDKWLLSYSASCTISKGRELNDKDLIEYISRLKKNKVIDDIYGNTIKRKLKKIYLKINLKKYIKSLRKD